MTWAAVFKHVGDFVVGYLLGNGVLNIVSSVGVIMRWTTGVAVGTGAGVIHAYISRQTTSPVACDCGASTAVVPVATAAAVTSAAKPVDKGKNEQKMREEPLEPPGVVMFSQIKGHDRGESRSSVPVSRDESNNRKREFAPDPTSRRHSGVF